MLIVYSDLDGTLLDHRTYDFSPAMPAIERLKRNGAPLVLATSKTWAETSMLQAEISIDGPCIVENGVIQGLSRDLETVTEPTGSELCTEADYFDICRFIDDLPSGLGDLINGFSTMTETQVAEHTGLAIKDASLAKQRLASEPFLWSGDDDQMAALKDLAEASGLAMTRGGRFYHLHKGQEKSQAAKTLTKAFQRTHPDRKIITAALGDAPNDFAMLDFADRGFLVTNPNNQGLEVPDHLNRPSIVRTEAPGPVGWAQAVGALMDELSFSP